MKPLIPGIGGTLLPDRYVARHLLDDVRKRDPLSLVEPDGLRRWWHSVAARLGPTAPLRSLFDQVAMPLFGRLGFSAHEATFTDRLCRVRLVTPRGTPVALVLTPWARRPSTRWADLARHASNIGATWGFVLSPPFLSIVPAIGSVARECIELSLPAMADGGGAYLTAVAYAGRFDPGGRRQTVTLEDLLGLASAYRDGVRADLQLGVETSLRELVPVIERTDAGSQGRPPDDEPHPAPTAEDEALTVVFRVLFLLFAESRRLVPSETPIYANGYTLERLCRDAVAGKAHGHWEALGATSRLLRLGCRTRDLEVEPFNGALFARRSAPGLEQIRGRGRRRDAASRDEAIRRTLVALGSRATRAGTETIDYRDLGVEQLGAVYERVLDLEGPRTAESAPLQPRASRHSRRRRETGTFYTPEPLAGFLVRRTLAPLVDGRSSDDILALRVLDPAMGSGAFLVAACHYLASALEQTLIDEGRLSPEDIDDDERARLRRRVAQHCLAGVDRNGTAVQLARLSLWLTTLARNRPLGFLDHQLRTGNSLVGAWPQHLGRVPTTGSRRPGVLPLLELTGLDEAIHTTVGPMQSLFKRSDDDVANVHAKAEAWRAFQASTSPLHRWRRAADLWCARWHVDAADGAPSAAEMRALVAAVVADDPTLPRERLRRREEQASRLSAQHGFFHWPLEFPGDFYDTNGHERTDAGFDAIIGNPPWEMVRQDDGERRANGPNLVTFVRQSGQYPCCGSGHLNLYQAFVDRSLALVRPGGRIGLVVPWGLATDDGAAALRRRLIDHSAIDLVVGVDNAAGLFPIHRGVRMAILTSTTGRATSRVRIVAGVRHAKQLASLPERGTAGVQTQELTPSELKAWTGSMMRLPDLRRKGDLDVLRSLVARHPRLGSPDGWNVSFGRELNATSIRDALESPTSAGMAVIEGKHLSPFRVHAATARRLPARALSGTAIATRTSRARRGYRDVAAVGNRLTVIAAVVPAGVVTTHTVFCLREALPGPQQYYLCAAFNSYVLNAIVRMLMGSHVTTTLAAQLPVPRWRGHRRDRRIAALARSLGGPAPAVDAYHEVQGLTAVQFGLCRSDFIHVLDGFPLVPAADRKAALHWFDRHAAAGSEQGAD